MIVLDCRGKRCPLPVIELARRVPDVDIGSVVRVLADDPAAAVDIPAWCRMRGQEFVGEGEAEKAAFSTELRPLHPNVAVNLERPGVWGPVDGAALEIADAAAAIGGVHFVTAGPFVVGMTEEPTGASQRVVLVVDRGHGWSLLRSGGRATMQHRP